MITCFLSGSKNEGQQGKDDLKPAQRRVFRSEPNQYPIRENVHSQTSLQYLWYVPENLLQGHLHLLRSPS